MFSEDALNLNWDFSCYGNSRVLVSHCVFPSDAWLSYYAFQPLLLVKKKVFSTVSLSILALLNRSKMRN